MRLGCLHQDTCVKRKDAFIVAIEGNNHQFVWRVLEMAGDSFMGYLSWQPDFIAMIPCDIFGHKHDKAEHIHVLHWLDVYSSPALDVGIVVKVH